MVNTKISALPVATTPVAGTAKIPIVQGGATKVTTAADLRNTPEPFVMTAQATGSVTASETNTIKMFARSYSGRIMPEFVSETGVDCFLQPSLINNNLMLWQPSVGTVAGTILGNTFTSVGTASHPVLASTNIQTAMRRTNWVTTATTAATTCGIRGNVPQIWRGNAANLGGFHAFFRFSQNTNLLGHQTFVGLAVSTAVLGGDPSALTDMIGIGYDGADAIVNGWQLMRNDATGAATKVSLGSSAPRDTSTVLDLSLYAPANASFIGVRVYNQSTQTVVLDNVAYTTDLPTNTAFLNFHVQTRVGTAGANQNLQLNKIYIDSDV